MATTAEALFKMLMEAGENGVLDHRESVYFDYKQANFKIDHKSLNDADKKILRKVLSGFANADGGVVIWGVEKKDNKDAEFRMISHPDIFVDQLTRATAETVTPPVGGVIHEVLFKNDSGAGVVITLVPPSDLTPHATVGEASSFYKRVGDGFSPMEYYEIADMFGRRNRPKLSLKFSAEYYEISNGNKFKIIIDLENAGRAMSQHYGFDLEFPDVLNTDNFYPMGAIVTASKNHEGYKILQFRSVNCIFPGETQRITPHNYVSVGSLTLQLDKVANRSDLISKEFFYTIYTENMGAQRYSIKIGDLLRGAKGL